MANVAMQPMRVGLLGLGTVGRGTWTVLNRNAEEISRRAGRPIRITRIATRAPENARALLQGTDSVEVNADVDALVRSPDVDIVLELIGGIEPARLPPWFHCI